MSSQIAYLFPGQGSQSVGMGRVLADGSATAGEVFRVASEALGEDLTRLAWQGPAADLDRTEHAQPALLATSVAFLRALKERHAAEGRESPRPDFYAGHSMGQYSAMVAAGVLELADAMRLVQERGRRMQASAPDGAMAAIIGLPDERIRELESIGRASGIMTVANRNAPGQIVISGERGAVEAATAAAKGLGAKRGIPLPVSVAAHSPLMTDAAEGMRGVLAEVSFRDPAAPLLANADARLLTTGAACQDELVEHLTQGVDWVRVVERMVSAGVSTALEVGPGKVLTGLARRIAPTLTAIPLDDAEAPDGLATSTDPADPVTG